MQGILVSTPVPMRAPANASRVPQLSPRDSSRKQTSDSNPIAPTSTPRVALSCTANVTTIRLPSDPAPMRMPLESTAEEPTNVGATLMLRKEAVGVEFHAILTHYFHRTLTHPLCEPSGSRCG